MLLNNSKKKKNKIEKGSTMICYKCYSIPNTALYLFEISLNQLVEKVNKWWFFTDVNLLSC